ncbi:hypothetical protein diail_7520 [Diaporthe ilicicola]|nr:hypothetical protein diail_7520 [Diaporthe ilicicola]
MIPEKLCSGLACHGFGTFGFISSFWSLSLTRADFPRNNVVFTKDLWAILSILSNWEKSDTNHGQDLTLELSASSPSDSQHSFRDYPGLQDDYPSLCQASTQRDYIVRYGQDITRGDKQLNDPFHDFSGGQHNSVQPQSWRSDQFVAERLIRPLLLDTFGVRFKRGQSKKSLPEVKMVSSFLLRRQFFRELHPIALCRLLRESLVCLRRIHYERWSLPHPLTQNIYDKSFGVLAFSLPSSMESLSLFEDSSSRHSLFHGPQKIRLRFEVLQGLKGRAANIKHLSISFWSDAIDCLKFPPDTFPNLESVAMTSEKHLKPDSFLVRELLINAARAAMEMPKLQIMELWNCENGHAAVFRYESTGTAQSSACRLTWGSSWYCPKSMIGERVLKAWARVAHKNASRQLTFVLDPLPTGSYAHYGAILHRLKLRNLIFDPTSTMQVRAGIEEEGQPEVPAWRRSTPYSPVRSSH